MHPAPPSPSPSGIPRSASRGLAAVWGLLSLALVLSLATWAAARLISSRSSDRIDDPVSAWGGSSDRADAPEDVPGPREVRSAASDPAALPPAIASSARAEVRWSDAPASRRAQPSSAPSGSIPALLSAPTFNGRPLRPAGTLSMTVTAYSPDARSCGKWADGRTASGMSVWTNGMKLVAADTRLLRFGTLVSVPGYHHGRPVPVLDRGGAIKGHRLDVLMPTHEIARRWGVRRLDVTVWEYAD